MLRAWCSAVCCMLTLAVGCDDSNPSTVRVDGGADGAVDGAPTPDGAPPGDAAAPGDATPSTPDGAAPGVDSGPPRTWPDPSMGAAFGDEFGGRLLGANLYGPDDVEFSLFAPNASSVAVAGVWGAQPMTREAGGVWSTRMTIADPVGQPYHFVLDGGRRVQDPYAKASRQHRGESLITDPIFSWTDGAWRRPERHELVIYEMQVADFTFDASSGVTAGVRGRYAGAMEKIDYLTRLGVNAVELMPVSESQSDDYTWGYNPALLFAPEAGYAEFDAQVREFQALVDALHAAGIAVIIDVVYNHMWGTGEDNPFHNIDSLYYFDFDDDGDIVDDQTPWGFKMATWRPMVRKLMYDNLSYWMDVMHVDGFRVDSTENMHMESVVDVARALDSDGYGEHYFILEEFDSGHNAQLRDLNAEVGHTLLSSWGTDYKGNIWSSMLDGSCSCDSLGVPTFFHQDHGWNAPAEVINYFSSHDEGTLTARHGASQAQVQTAAAHLLTSMGIPMIWMGEEFQRLHYGNHHPDGGGANVARVNNTVDWRLADEHSDLVDYFAALIHLRVEHPALHAPSSVLSGWNVVDWRSAIGYTYSGVSGDNDFVVLVNYSGGAQSYDVDFPVDGSWYVMCDGRRAVSTAPGLETLPITGPRSISVPARTAMVYMSERANP